MRRLLALFAAFVVACGPAGSTRADPTATPTAPVTGVPPTASAVASPSSTPRAALLTKVFKDVRTGEEFTLGQFSGRVTLVQHMAVW